MNIVLSWTPKSCSSPLGQRVEYKRKSSSTWILFASVPCEVSTVYIPNLPNDELYEFRVGALCSEEGLESSISYSGYDIKINLVCPTDLELTPADTSIDYSFTGSAGDVDSYDVVLYNSSNVELDRVNELNAGVITGSFTGLAVDTEYKVKLEPIAYFERFTKTDCTSASVRTLLPVAPPCATAQYDLIIVNDESGSIPLASYNNYIKQGILDIARQTSALIDSSQVKLGVIGFSNTVRTRVALSGDYPYIFNAISTMGYMGSTTGTAEALRKAQEWVNTQARNVPVKVILITDGFPNKCYNYPSGSASCPASLALQQAVDAATILKSTIKGGVPVEIITIGVTSSVGVEFLRDQISSDVTRYYSAQTFEEFQSVAEAVALSICTDMPTPLPDPCFAPTSVTASLTYSTGNCLVPSGVGATLLTTQVTCNPPSNVNASLRITCARPSSVIASIL